MCSYGENHWASVLLAFGHPTRCSFTRRPGCPLHPANSFLFSRKSSLKCCLSSVTLLCAPGAACSNSLLHITQHLSLWFICLSYKVCRKEHGLTFFSFKPQFPAQSMARGTSLVSVCWLTECVNIFLGKESGKWPYLYLILLCLLRALKTSQESSVWVFLGRSEVEWEPDIWKCMCSVFKKVFHMLSWGIPPHSKFWNLRAEAPVTTVQPSPGLEHLLSVSQLPLCLSQRCWLCLKGTKKTFWLWENGCESFSDVALERRHFYFYFYLFSGNQQR